MFSIPVHIDNGNAGPQKGCLIEFGCPMPKGLLTSFEGIVVKDADSLLPYSAEITARWADNSIKWLHIETRVDFEAGESKTLLIVMKPEKSEVTTAPQDSRFQTCGVIAQTDEAVVISHSGARYSFTRTEEGFSIDVEGSAGKVRIKAPAITSKEGEKSPLEAVDFKVSQGVGVDAKIQVEVSGSYKAKDLKRDIAAKFSLSFLPFSSLVRGSFTIHNPNAAKHFDGLWDLGDPGSFLFANCDLDVEYPGEVANYRLDYQPEWLKASEPVTIIQGGSGGEHWDSPIHVNANNKVAVKQKGYTVKMFDGSADLGAGLRASPAAFIEGPEAGGKGLFFKPHQFWQNFPKSISLTKEGIKFGIFPSDSSDSYELQGGEKKTHKFFFSVSSSPEQFEWSYSDISVAVDPQWIDDCGVVPGLRKIENMDAMEALINLGVSHPQHSFFHKREEIDEYGWRHFGDLYADHETAEFKGRDLFVSHYNNQYDPIYGLLRQYFATGQKEWLWLADDLARHVSDIDIYDTEDDKFEYNGGLFWHTDHYVDAQTSTHRTYSARQQKGVYQDHAGGGGPGGQHCYTTGLMYHYFITGTEASRRAVLRLTDWITCVYEGNGGVLEYLLALKNARNPGLKNPLTRKYPLDRGTGNYLVALLDSYQLTLDNQFLKRSAQVIRNTVNPAEDISLRNLHNVEETWFYTIFFQAVVKFILLKQDADQLDSDFYYARDSLLHFARWMMENEYPYLDKPEILEFPNHTWVAQDVRKSYVLTYAAMYCPDVELGRQMLKKAKFFENYVVDRLKNEETNYYTRILAILMQNHGFLRQLKVMTEQDNWREILGIKAEAVNTPVADYPVPVHAGAATQWWAAGCELMKRLVQLSLNRELDWLSKRSEKIAAWVNR